MNERCWQDAAQAKPCKPDSHAAWLQSCDVPCAIASDH